MTKVKILKSKNEIRGELFQVKCARVEAVIYDAETKDLPFNILNAEQPKFGDALIKTVDGTGWVLMNGETFNEIYRKIN